MTLLTRQGYLIEAQGMTYLAEADGAANARYLDALAAVADPRDEKRDLDRITTPKKNAAGRRYPSFNPLARHDAELFHSLMAGEHCLRGFTNRDIRGQLQSTLHLRACGHDPRKQSAKVSHIFACTLTA